MTRAAAVPAWISGLGFGLPAVLGLRHFAQHHEVWSFIGFPTYGGGPFERWGIPTSVPLLADFVAVCAAEIVVGVLLWSKMVREASTLWPTLGRSGIEPGKVTLVVEAPRRFGPGAGLLVPIEKLTDFAQIVTYDVMSTPALVIDEKVVQMGRVPSVDELRTLLAGTRS